MSEKVQIELTVEQAQAVNAWIKNNQAIVQNEESLKKLGDASEKASRKSKDGHEQAGAALLRWTQGMLSGITVMSVMTKAAQLYNAELENTARLNRSAFDHQMDKGVAQRKAVMALGMSADMTPQQMVAMVEKEARDPASVYQMLDAAISAAGDLGAERATRTAIAADKFGAHLGVEERSRMAAGALQLQKGSPEYNPEQAIAKQSELQEVSAVADPGNFAKNVMPAIAQARAFGGNKDDVGLVNALFSSIQQRMGDEEGSTSSTAVIGMLKQLSIEGRKAGLFAEGASIEEQLDAIQGDSKEAVALRRKLLGPMEKGYSADQANQKAGRESDPKLRAEARSYIPVSEILQGGSQTDKMYREFAAKGGSTPAESLAKQQALLDVTDSLPEQQAHRAQQALKKAADSFKTSKRAAGAIAAEDIPKLLRESGQSDFETTWDQRLENWRGGTGVEKLERGIGLLEHRRNQLFLEGQRAPAGSEEEAVARAAATELETQTAVLREVLATLKTPKPVELKPAANVVPQATPAAGLND
ncbi:MAG: hypothetical protein M3Q42_11780 [Pseudomonadota bacterium]|nr:hypothetical protein [Pseudomonadota bacterium]